MRPGDRKETDVFPNDGDVGEAIMRALRRQAERDLLRWIRNTRLELMLIEREDALRRRGDGEWAELEPLD
jgi:hypothetical protein